MIIAGFYDNSFRFYKENKLISVDSPIFHRKPISCLIVNENKGLLICGGKDYRISIWKYDWETLEILSDPIRKPSNILYGHEGEITHMNYNEDTDLLISFDKEGVFLMFSIKNKQFLKKFTVFNEKFNMGIIHSYGIITAFSQKRMFLFK